MVADFNGAVAQTDEHRRSKSDEVGSNPIRPSKFMKRIIFLDIDGVLVNRRSFTIYKKPGKHCMADPDCVAALNHITDTTGARIVLSSTWRKGRSVANIRSLLKSWGVKAHVIGKTPILDGQVGRIWISVDRGTEIAHWLKNKAPCEFVILDDDGDMNSIAHRLVQTKFDEGLTMKHAEKATALFEE